MKILLVSTFDEGGAPKACVNVHKGLDLLDEKPKTLVLRKKTKEIENIFEFEKEPIYSLKERLINKYNRLHKEFKLPAITSKDDKERAYLKMINQIRPQNIDTFSLPTSKYDITQSKYYQEADIINFHWVANFLDYPSFFPNNNKPIVWTLHDQNPFSGGEHYHGLLHGMKEDGTPIKRTKYSEKEYFETQKLLNIKIEALKSCDNLHIVAPSKWLLNSSKNSKLFSKLPHYYVPYGYPTSIYKPYNKSFARDVLNISTNKKVLLFVGNVKGGRKGFSYLQKALENLGNTQQIRQKLLLVVVGGGKIESKYLKNNILRLGTIKDERILALSYAAADALILPSLEDNLPNTMIEALLCGTPVVGFPIGGVVDAIEDGKNGYITENVSVKALEVALYKVLNDSLYLGNQQIADEAKEKYSLEKQAIAYKNLFQSILQGFK